MTLFLASAVGVLGCGGPTWSTFAHPWLQSNVLKASPNIALWKATAVGHLCSCNPTRLIQRSGSYSNGMQRWSGNGHAQSGAPESSCLCPAAKSCASSQSLSSRLLLSLTGFLASFQRDDSIYLSRGFRQIQNAHPLYWPFALRDPSESLRQKQHPAPEPGAALTTCSKAKCCRQVCAACIARRPHATRGHNSRWADGPQVVG